MKPEKIVLATQDAPAAIGPYSQAIAAGDCIYTSGQLPIDMATGELETIDIRKATRNALNNVRAILTAAGSSMENVVKTVVYMVDLSEFAAMNEEYATYFQTPPARSCVQVAALPKGAKVEIEAIALR